MPESDARNAGANDFLVKPVSAKSVYLRIRSTMEHPPPFVRSQTYFGPDRRRTAKEFMGEDRRDET